MIGVRSASGFVSRRLTQIKCIQKSALISEICGKQMRTNFPRITQIGADIFSVFLNSQKNTMGVTIQVVEHDSQEYWWMVELRSNVLRKPLGLSFSEDELENEKANIHIVAFEHDKLVGCCMLIPDGSKKIRLRQMAVLSELQGKGVGSSLINFAENFARKNGYRMISMHARKDAAGFYEKLGYKIIGETFIEVTIPHYILEKNIQASDG